MPVPGILLVLPAAAGLALGSYAATAGLRLAESAPSTFGRSRCDGCGKALSFAATAPVVSYVALRGRCNSCGGRIDPLHLIGELTGAAVCVGAFAVLPVAQAVLASAVGLLLLAAAVVDLRIRRLPNLLTGSVAGLGLTLAWLRGPTAAVEGVAAALAVSAILLAVRRLSAQAGGEPGLGLGDVKLFAALALWIGSALSVTVVAAALLGIAGARWLRDANGRLPFGPMIALAGWLSGLAVQAGWSPWRM